MPGPDPSSIDRRRSSVTRAELDEVRASQSNMLAKLEDVLEGISGVEAERAYRRAREETRDKNRTLLLRISYALVGIGAAVAAPFGYQAATSPPEVKPADVEATVNERVGSLEDQTYRLAREVERNSDAVRFLGYMHKEQRKFILEVRDELAGKLDKISARAAAVEEPPTVSAAREEVANWERYKRDHNLDQVLDSPDPLAK